MSDSNRSGNNPSRLRLWLGLAVLLAVTVIGVLGIQHFRYYSEAASHAAGYSRDAYNQISEECFRPHLDEKCAQERRYTARENQRDEYDLYSQKAMALWTAVMGVMAVVGVSLSGVGVYLIWGTWRQTAEAADSARRTLHSYVAKERALIAINQAVAASDPESKRDGFVVKIENRGMAPATIVMTQWSYMQVREWPDTFNQSDDSKRTLPQDGEGRTPLLSRPDGQMGHWPFLVGMIEYVSLNERYFTPFSFLLTHHPADGYRSDWWSAQECSTPGMPDHT